LNPSTLSWSIIPLPGEILKPEKKVVPGLRKQARELNAALGSITGKEILAAAIVAAMIITLSLRSLLPTAPDKTAVILVTTVLFFVFVDLLIRSGYPIGHGSGSFGHVAAQKYGTRAGVGSPEGWRGFAEVWWEAARLNRLVIDALHAAGLPVVAFPPSGGALTRGGGVWRWEVAPVRAALEGGLVPVVYGDVVFDIERGGSILSTEEALAYLARQFRPDRVLIAGIEPGVWADYPACTRILPEITPEMLPQVALHGSAATDVTGGMASKVAEMLQLTGEVPGLKVDIFSGETPGRVQEALLGRPAGTRLLTSPSS